ncbi:MAG: hypothetical protein GY947_20255 [Rhodobacteraceae bacterium]|nr:hypothetical protein [Paracoccaceae bacterium]
MTDDSRFKIDLAFKIVAAFIAVFGVWKYFADRDDAVSAAAKASSIVFIDKYASANMVKSREALFGFWLKQDAFVAHIRANAITPREYKNFIRFALPRYGARKVMQSALFSLANLYDQIYHCRQAKICDDAILDDYFCPRVAQQQKIYGPFYDLLRADVASADFGLGVLRYAKACPTP